MEAKQTQIDEQEKDYQELIKRNAMTIAQIEEDRDQELNAIKEKNEENKSQVHDMALKSKAELQLIKNKMKDIQDEKAGLTRNISDQTRALKKQEEILAQHSNDIKVLYKQIAEKDADIADNETRIFLLKRKTQELEKFKFVLDDRIKELKKEITPKEQQIQELQKQTNDRDKELRVFNTLNASLGFIVEELRFKQENMQAAIRAANSQIRKNESYIRLFKNAVYWVTQNIDDHEKLKVSVIEELKWFVEDHNQKIVVEDSDIHQENKVQMTFLKKSVDALHNKLQREQAEHARNRIAVMEINQKLILQIGDDEHGEGLRFRIADLRKTFESNEVGGAKTYKEVRQKMAERDRMLDRIEQHENVASLPSGRSLQGNTDSSQVLDPEIQSVIQAKKQLLDKMRDQINQLKQQNEMLRQQHSQM